VAAGKKLFDQFRDDYDVYIGELRQGRQEARNHLSLMTNLLFVAVIASALIAAIGGIVLWYLMRRWVSKPVVHLASEARVVSDGELRHEVSTFGPPEFIQLGLDVEAMRERLVAQIAAVETAGQEVAQARAALEEQAQELQRSNRELEQFAYVASHDLQEPLRKVASFCQMLERRYKGQLDERADQYIHFAVDGAKRMQQLINDLLEFSRVGRLSTPQIDVDLMECLRNGLFNLQVAREESDAEVTSDDLPHVLGEAPLLTQLLQNLIGNAIKFHSDQPPKVHVGVRRDGDDWQFWVSDNGIGIEPEYAERVFLIFQRLHAKETYGGTGIGLAMCKKIVEHHGGRIWVDESTPGAPGTTVRFTLPVVRSSAPPVDKSSQLSDVLS
jgi:signal transduction histidine kinase